MSLPDRPLLADLKAQLSGLKADLGQMLQLRWELARVEIQADLEHLKRLVLIWGISAVTALTSLPLFAACGADALDGRLGIAAKGWLLIFGLALLCTAVICAFFGWLRFRIRFVGLKQSLEELREDLEWIKEGMRDEG
jgi:Putative Actinobacterial Holin-X, holin superfamily III